MAPRTSIRNGRPRRCAGKRSRAQRSAIQPSSAHTITESAHTIENAHNHRDYIAAKRSIDTNSRMTRLGKRRVARPEPLQRPDIRGYATSVAARISRPTGKSSARYLRCCPKGVPPEGVPPGSYLAVSHTWSSRRWCNCLLAADGGEGGPSKVLAPALAASGRAGRPCRVDAGDTQHPLRARSALPTSEWDTFMLARRAASSPKVVEQ